MKKITKLTIRNIGALEDVTLELNKPLLLFYGDIRQGKSTILNSLRWNFGGPFPDDVIRHGAEEAAIRIDFIDGDKTGWVQREFYRGRDGETKARAIEFVEGGRLVANPVAELKRFLNPFLLNQDYLRDMTELERRRYFVEVFGIDTKQFDEPLRLLESQAAELRIQIKAYGDPDTTAVEPVDESAIRAQIDRVRETHKADTDKLRREFRDIQDAYENARRIHVAAVNNYASAAAARSLKHGQLVSARAEVASLSSKLREARAFETRLQAELDSEPQPVEPQAPTAPDTASIESKLRVPLDTAQLEAQLVEAARANERYKQFQANLKKVEQKKADKEALLEMERQERWLRQSKIDQLKKIAEDSGIAGLGFNEDLSFSYQGTSAGMLSTSQLMTLSNELSRKYPEGFGLELIDRAESLGASVFLFVEKAKAQSKTILATIVGERPAKAPEEVGVFVVKDGKVF